MDNWDVVVVGAGPGGTTAGRSLARAGLKVLILEKEKVPRYKPCGGGLTAKVRDTLDFDFSPAVEQTITQISVAYGPERTRTGAGLAWAVMRAKFDALLAERAVDAGCEFRDAQPVTRIDFDSGGATVVTKSGAVRGSLVVGADGVNGLTRRAAGLPPHRRMAVALEAEMDAPSAALEAWRAAFHVDFGAIPWGYAWIFPKAEHLSVGIGHLMRRGKSRDLRTELSRYVGSEPTLEHATEMFARGHRVPLGGQNSRYHAARALLVGDAAGVVDPFTAEGIYYAIRSGQIAGEEIARACGRGDFDLTPYTQRINSEINADFRYAWLLTQFFYRMPHLAFRALARSVTVQGAAMDAVVGVSSYRRSIFDGLKRIAGSVARGRV